MTREEIDANIDSNITNKTLTGSITPIIDGANRKAMLDYVDNEIENVASLPGPQGPIGLTGPQGDPGATGVDGLQGPQGIQGIAGPIGPAGLNWQGQWVSGTSYVEDDAVGFDGASWFCILATSGSTNPDVDTTHWALLASQGAQGIQGPQGIQGEVGPQGLQGEQGVQGQGITPKTSGAINLTGTFQVLPFDINSCSFQGGKAFLPATTENGKEILVIAVANNIEIRANANGTNFMFENFNTFVSSVILPINQMYRFTFIGFGGYWKAEKLEVTPYKSYVALLTQVNNNAPTATVLENNIGNISFVRISQGFYKAISDGLFLLNKTSYNTYIADNSGQTHIVYREDDNQIVIAQNGELITDNNLFNTPFEIRIYN
jgi:hypothetical protein